MPDDLKAAIAQAFEQAANQTLKTFSQGRGSGMSENYTGTCFFIFMGIVQYARSTRPTDTG